MNFSGLVTQYGSSDSSGESSGSLSHEQRKSETKHRSVTKLEVKVGTKRPRAASPDNRNAQDKSHLSRTRKLLRPPPPPPSFATSATTPSSHAPPPPSFATSTTKLSSPVPPSRREPNLSQSPAEDSSPMSKHPGRVLQTSIHFLPPQVRTNRPNLSTEDLSLYGCKKSKQ